MIRSVIYKDDSFIAEFVLRNELSEAIKEAHCISNVDTDKFEVVASGSNIGVSSASPRSWTTAPNYSSVFIQVLKKLSTTPSGYFRFKQPLFKYKLESDADTDPYRAVYGEPPEVILVDIPLFFVFSEYFDESRPYASDFKNKISKVFRVIDVDGIDSNRLEFYRRVGFRAIGTLNNMWVGDVQINLGGTINGATGIYKTESAIASDEVATITHFGFNMPTDILVAKAGEDLKYYDLTNVNDGEGDNNLFPLVKNGNKAYVLLNTHAPSSFNFFALGLTIAENSYFKRDDIYNLIANVFAIFHKNNSAMDYYDLNESHDPLATFTLPDNLLLIDIWKNEDLHKAIQSDASLQFTANSELTQEVTLWNLSKDPKTVSKLLVKVDDQIIHEQDVNKSVGVRSCITITLNCQLPSSGSEFRLEFLDENGEVLAHMTRTCTFTSG